MSRTEETVSRLRALTRLALAALVVLASLAPAKTAHAYAWMVRHGEMQCANCHADPSGGELLTKYGRLEGYELLRMKYERSPAGQEAGPATSPKTGFLWGLWDTPSWLLLGGSLRGAAFAQGDFRVFPMQLDLYGQIKLGRFRMGGSLGAAKVRQNSPNAREAFVTANQGNELNLVSRTHWLALDLGKASEWTLRAGRLNLPFGVRVSEHYLWVRDVTRTDRDADQQHGGALAYSGSKLRTEVMGIAGNYQIRPDRYRERGYSGHVEYAVNDGLGVGVSSLLTVAKADRVSFEQLSTTRGVHGAFARARLTKPLVLLAEADVLHTSRRGLGYAGFAQLDYEFIQGLHAIGTAEVLDRGLHDTKPGTTPYSAVAGQGNPQAGLWLSLDWFLLPQLEARIDGILRQGSGASFLAQIHAYL